VHRDIKPANIRVGRHGTVKLLDFGIARTDTLAREAKTATDMMVGSLPYMAPERFFDAAAPHPAADVFALGCVLFEGIARQRFFEGLDMPQILGLTHAATKYEPYFHAKMGALPASLPADLRDLLARSLALDPGIRPSAEAFGKACDAAVARLDNALTLRAWCRNRRWPGPRELPAGWVGQTLTEGSLVRPISQVMTTPLAATTWEPAKPRATAPATRRRGWIGLFAASLALLGVGGLGIGGAVVLAVLWTADRGPAVEAIAPAVEPAPAVPAASGESPLPSNPDGETRAQPIPAEPTPASGKPAAASGKPAAASGKPAIELPAHLPTPAADVPAGPIAQPAAPIAQPAAPIAQPAAAPTPARANAHVTVEGSQRAIELRGAGGQGIAVPGAVEAGSYAIWADFGQGLRRAGQADIAVDTQVKLACNAIRATCVVR
jgi:serine/threonine-protein kinase